MVLGGEVWKGLLSGEKFNVSLNYIIMLGLNLFFGVWFVAKAFKLFQGNATDFIVKNGKIMINSNQDENLKSIERTWNLAHCPKKIYEKSELSHSLKPSTIFLEWVCMII